MALRYPQIFPLHHISPIPVLEHKHFLLGTRTEWNTGTGMVDLGEKKRRKIFPRAWEPTYVCAITLV